MELLTVCNNYLSFELYLILFLGFFAAAFMVFVAVHRYQGKKVLQGIPNIAVVTLFTLCTTYIIIDVWDEYYALVS